MSVDLGVWMRIPTGSANVEYQRGAAYAFNGYSGRGGACIEESYHYPGSPPPHYGQTEVQVRDSSNRRWPHVRLDCSFPAGREDLRDKLGVLLRATVDAFLKEHGLDGEAASP